MIAQQPEETAAEGASYPVRTPVRAGAVEQIAECLNCRAPLSGRFCSECGQPIVRRLNAPQVLRNFAHQLFELDSAILRTVLGLSLRPGRMARDYVEGRRTVYLNPLKYAFFATTLFVFLVSLLQERTHLLGENPVHPLALVSLYLLFLGVAGDPLSVLGFGLAAVPYLEWFVRLLPYAMFVFLVPLAALQKQLFRQEDLNVSECYVFQVYTFGHLMLVHLLMITFGLYGSTIGYGIAHLVELGYLTWALSGFHRTGLFRSGAGALASQSTYRLLFTATFLLVVWLAVE